MAKILEAVFILDASGSMDHLTSDTIGGFNSTIKQKKKESGFEKILVTTVTFNTEIKTVHDRINIAKVKKLTEKEYVARGCTALYDAIGKTINHIAYIRKYLREEDVPEYTMFFIITDGLENSSREFSHEDITKLIDEKGEDGWEFIFLGANIDVEKESDSIGVGAYSAFDATGDGVRDMWAVNVSKKLREDAFEERPDVMNYCRECCDLGIDPNDYLKENDIELSVREKNALKREQKKAQNKKAEEKNFDSIFDEPNNSIIP